eukprot:Skav226267  [mRNA]  locus=scaffold2708:211670:229914:- [translate_table: standard]
MAENAASQPILDVKSQDVKGKKKAGRATAKAAGAGGSYFLPPQAQVLQTTVQVPRRFPGHFMPHRLCNHWNLQGWCKKAETCTFAHGIEELHPDVQAQLLQQKPGMPPPTVTKDGRLVVHGVTKPAGKVVGTEVQGFSMQNLTNIYPQTSVLGSGALPFNGTTSYPFNLTGSAGRLVSTSLVPDVDKENEEDAAENTGSLPGTPSKRHRPAPLSLDDIAEGNGPAMMVRPLVSPTVASNFTLCAPLASPMRVSVVSRPLPPPISTGLTPTSMCASSMAASVAMAAISTPKTTPVPTSLTSPVRVTQSYTCRTPTGLIWPASPGPTLLSPKNPTTPVPIDRNTLLQARSMAVRMEQGPPGLAMWAPTPTTKANLLGFRYPEPGYMSVAPRT